MEVRDGKCAAQEEIDEEKQHKEDDEVGEVVDHRADGSHG